MAVRVQALFGKKTAPAPKKGTTATKKVSSGSKSTKGWFGGDGGSSTSLDKWYGE